MIDRKWKRASLSEVCEINPGKKDLLNKSKEQEVAFLPMAAVSEEGKILARESRKLKDVIKGYTNFRDGDVLLAKITPCFENGKRAIAKDLLNGIGFGSTEFHVLRPKDEVTSNWIFYAISRSDFCNIAKSQMTGTAGQKRVPAKVLEQFEIPIPSVKEQEAITDNIETQFTRLDAAIKSLKTIKAKLELYRKSVLKAVFTTRATDFQHIFKLEDVVEVQSGFAFKGTDFTGHGIPVIRISNIQDGNKVVVLGRNQPRYSKQLDDKVCKFLLKQDDILIALSGATTGKIGIFKSKEKALLNQRIALLRAKDGRSNRFIYYYLQTKSQQILKDAYGGAQPNISPKKIEKYEIYYPDEALRNQIVQSIESQFSVVDKVGDIVGVSLAKAEKLRRSILKSAFEGKLV